MNKPFDRDDLAVSPDNTPTFAQVAAQRLSRRGFLTGMLATAATACAGPGAQQPQDPQPAPQAPKPAPQPPKGGSTLGFEEIERGLDETLHVPSGHRAQVVIRWGDPVLPDAPAFDPQKQSPKAQAGQFGTNNDFIAYMPLPAGSDSSDHGLLVVNHEYSDCSMMFPGSPRSAALNREQMEMDLLSNGLSVVEIKRQGEQWQVVQGSQYARRITPRTPTRFTGPAAGSPRMRTEHAPEGRRGLGTMGNCAGGVTPWGTVLTAEENVNNCFLGDPSGHDESKALERFGYTKNLDPPQHWGRFFPRFELSKSPKEPNHFGWIVEVDPYDPASTPRKRTALGRFKHEGCGITIDPRSQRVVGYMGDDQRFEYIYRFVSDDPYRPQDRAANLELLDKGTLSAARFLEDGRVQWLPLVFGQGPLTPENGFQDQGDVLIEARRAADLLGATRMDRPEDIEVNPVTGSAFVMLTRNKKRTEDQTNPANPRSHNEGGHVVEIFPLDGDHTAPEARWDFLLLAGDINKPLHAARYHEAISENGWFVSPDNCTFDKQGRIWISTDGANSHGFADGIWACDVTGTGRALTRHFLRAPLGAEVTGPCFTPDNSTFFCSIQHPAEDSSFDQPSTRWPDFSPQMPPRSSVVAVRREDGEPLG